jgi:hypothetical protein
MHDTSARDDSRDGCGNDEPQVGVKISGGGLRVRHHCPSTGVFVSRPSVECNRQSTRSAGAPVSGAGCARSDADVAGYGEPPPPAPGLLFLVPATVETYFATDWIWLLDRVLPNAGIPPPPLVTWWTTSASDGLS